jgi:hypothetical protein
MARRLRDVCTLPESEPPGRAGRGFVVRDLPGKSFTQGTKAQSDF